ncbi:DNA/RNA non-specific endonuclease [Streptomyces sp. NPDC003996]
MQRGHILANQLGGTGLDRRNLLPLYTAVNSPRMSAVEKVVADRIANHETMYYEVTAGYTGDNLVPDSVNISWWSMTTGESDTVNLPNTP